MIKRLLIIALLFTSTHSIAQYYIPGVEPFSTHWRQIKVRNHRIVFPSEAEKIANRYANLLSIVDTIAPKSLESDQKSFNVLIHNHSSLSNGFVAWAPKRMEIIAQSPSSQYAQPWLTQLALHETRHTSQMFKLNEGMFYLASFAFGEQIVGLASSFVPIWFLEGDAVAFETASSNSGRGRQADFYQYYRAHYLTRTKRFKYDKWLMGSFKDDIPSHYNFGYQLVTYAKIKYGNQVWAKTLKNVTENPFTVLPFYFGLKKQTRLSRKQLFLKTFNQLDSLWSTDQERQVPFEYEPLVKENTEYTDYRYPYPLNDSILVAYKANLSEISRFILVNIQTKKERTIIHPGYLTSIPSYYKENIFWTEYLPHVRWEYKNYSIIKYVNILTGRAKSISDRGRYFSPVYNPSDGLVYAISGKDDGSSTIEAFSLDGERKKSVSLPEYYNPFELLIDVDKNYLISGVISDRGKSIVRVNDDGTCTLIYGPTYLDIHSISSFSNYLYFSTSVGYKEDLFAVNIESKATYQLTKSAFGSTDPSCLIKSNELFFSNYTVKGYCISKTMLDTVNTRIFLNDINDDTITRRLSSTEKINIDSIAIPDKTFEVDRYRGFNTLFNFHSWSPFFFDPFQLTTGESQAKLGVTFFSQNLTGSSVLTAGYGYGKSHLARVSYQYYGLFPVISYEFVIGGDTATINYEENTTYPSIAKQKTESRASVYLPLTLTAHRFSTILYPYANFISTNDYFYSTSDELYHKGFHRFNYRLYFSSTQKFARKDIRPRLGIIADINLENAPFNRNNFGSLLSSDLSVFLPGLFRNHSVLAKGSFQDQTLKRFYFSNRIIFPRGYANHYSKSFRSVSFEYLMPLAYPDFAFSSIAYLKRISLNVFYDYAENEFPISSGKQTDVMKSFGFEIFTDVNFLRTRYPFRLKFQQGWAGGNLSPFNLFSVSMVLY